MLDWKDASLHELRLSNVYGKLFRNHHKLLEMLFELKIARLRKPPEDLLEEIDVYSSGERILIQVALDLWDGSGKAYFWDILYRLDNEILLELMQGLEYLKLIPSAGAKQLAPIKNGMLV